MYSPGFYGNANFLFIQLSLNRMLILNILLEKTAFLGLLSLWYVLLGMPGLHPWPFFNMDNFSELLCSWELWKMRHTIPQDKDQSWLLSCYINGRSPNSVFLSCNAITTCSVAPIRLGARENRCKYAGVHVACYAMSTKVIFFWPRSLMTSASIQVSLLG